MYALALFIYRSPTAHLIQRGPFRLHFLTPVDLVSHNLAQQKHLELQTYKLE
jgi:hypothetical protein